ncbi:hypothetical protein V9L20_02335 [Variovorax sp. CCNWLW225]|uniref:site-specific integrase n=1 Tax=Variovorax sp. CCNWLW225 TaxID=3127462 RepID=UPI0030777B35
MTASPAPLSPSRADQNARKLPIWRWNWPVAPQTIRVYDKYVDQTCTISGSESKWNILHKGGQRTFSFAHGDLGVLQRRLVLLTQSSPGEIVKLAAVVVRDWKMVERMLRTSPENIRSAWEKTPMSVRQSWVVKKILKVTCKAEVGHWKTKFYSLVSSLDTRANEQVQRRTAIRLSRAELVSPDLQGAIAHVLDAASLSNDLCDANIEGLVGLSLIFQHGVRPVQVLCLRTEHVQFFTDASGDFACVVSFHAAKQKHGNEFEILRQVKPEWVPLISRLHRSAISDSRSRLFRTSDSTALWSNAKAACKQFKLRLTCTAPALRHTAAQTLADAGHSRKSIQHFLGHTYEHSARTYIQASLKQADLINSALGASKLYTSIRTLADKTFISVEQLSAASEDEQVGAVVGSRLVTGVGICKVGQGSCSYNPVTSCYGCPKFMPALNRRSHEEAIAGMREQIQVYLLRGLSDANPAYRQLTAALSGAQQALATIDQLGGDER